MNINKKIAMSGMSILSALVLLGGTAFAAFSGTATAQGNTFSTGNGDLQISLNGADFDTTVSNPFNGTNIAPGYNSPFTFYLKNTSSANVALGVTGTFSNVNDNGGLYNDLTSDISCTNQTTNETVDGGTYSVAAMNGGSVTLGSLEPGQIAQCTATFALPLSSTLEGTNVSFDAVFNGTQTP